MDIQHAGKASTVALAPDYRMVGLWCERHFARVIQVPMPLRLNPHGNRRRAFVLGDGTTVDVIGRRVPQGHIYPDLTRRHDARHRVDALVLVAFNGWDAEPEIVGWQTEHYVKTEGVVGEYRSGVPNYTVSWRALESISTLAERHAINHPLAGKDERPYFWSEGVTTFTTPAPAPAPKVEGTRQESLF